MRPGRSGHRASPALRRTATAPDLRARASADDPGPLLERLQEERPGLFEWAPLTAGPPWRIEVARRETSSGEPAEITRAVEWDHDRLDRLERTAFDAWGAGDSQAAAAAFVMFAHGLRRHMGFEEELLFPEFERRNGSGSTAALQTEHSQIVALLSAMELAIRAEVVPAPVLRGHLQELLSAHNRKEEEALYPLIDGVLTDCQRDEVLRRVQRFHP